MAASVGAKNPKGEEEQASDDNVDGGASQGDEQFLSGFPGHALQASDPPNRKEGNVAGLNAIAAGGEGVS